MIGGIKMNVIETIIVILLLLLVITTFITEPKTTINYFKAYFKSGIAMYQKVSNFIKSFQKTEVNINESGTEVK